MIRTCRHCEIEFKTEKYNKLSCTPKCANLFRYRNPVNHKAYAKYRGSSYRAFLMSLRTKLGSRRDLDIDFLCELYNRQSGLCSISGRQLTFTCGHGVIPTNISIDRIDPYGDYSETNVQLVCRQANTMKQRLSREGLIEWCQDIVNTNDKRKKK